MQRMEKLGPKLIFYSGIFGVLAVIAVVGQTFGKTIEDCNVNDAL